MVAENPLYGGAAPTLLVRSQGTDWSLSPGPGYLVGRDPDSDIAISDGRISWQHAVLRFEDGRWVLADNDSTNGTYVDGQRVDRIDIIQECQVRLGNPADGALLTCTVSRTDQSAWHGGPATQVAASPTVTSPVAAPGPVPPPPGPAVRTRRIGRAPDNDIVVADPAASRHHAELQIAAGACRIVDLDSNNGTYVNGQRVTIAYLADGDLISIGPATFRLSGQDLKELHAAEVAAVAATGLYPAPGSQAGQAPPAEPGSGAVAPASPPRAAESVTPPASAAADGGPLEIPYAVRWLVPDGERFANFDILNDNDSQLDLLPRVRPHLRCRDPDQEMAPGGRVRPRAARRGGGQRGAVRQARRGDQLLPPAEQLTRCGHLGDRRQREHRDDPPCDAPLVFAAAPAHAAGADEGAGAQACRQLGAAAGRRAGRRPHLDGALHPGGLRARCVQLQLRPPRRQRRSAPVRGRRPGEYQGEHRAGRRAAPRLHAVRLVRGGARR